MSDNTNRTKADDTANLSVGRSSLVGTAGKFLLAIFGFVGVVYFYRDLGPTKIGSYYTVLAGVKIATQFQNSVTSAIQKRVSEVDVDQSAYLGIGLLTWVLTTVGGGVAIVFAAPLTDQLGISTAHLIGGLAMMSSLGLFATINQFYVGIGNPGKSTWIDAVRSVLTLGGQVALLVFGFGEFGLIGGFVFGSAVTAVGLLITVGIAPSVPSRHVVERTVDFAKWSLPNGLTTMIYDRLDVLILSWFIGSTAVGYYQPALQLTEPATFVASSIGASLSIKSSGVSSQGGSVVSDLRNGIAYSGLVAIPLFFGVLALPTELMGTIFGPSATAAAGALVGLALFRIARSFLQPMSNVILGIDRHDLNLKIILSVLVLNVPLAVVLVSEYGLIGVIIATVVAELFRLVLSTAVVTHLFGFPGFPREVFEQLFAAVVMFGVIEALTATAVVKITSVYLLAFVISTGAAIYFVVLIAVSRKFRNTTRIVVGETLPF